MRDARSGNTVIETRRLETNWRYRTYVFKGRSMSKLGVEMHRHALLMSLSVGWPCPPRAYPSEGSRVVYTGCPGLNPEVRPGPPNQGSAKDETQWESMNLRAWKIDGLAKTTRVCTRRTRPREDLRNDASQASHRKAGRSPRSLLAPAASPPCIPVRSCGICVCAMTGRQNNAASETGRAAPREFPRQYLPYIASGRSADAPKVYYVG